MARGKRKLHTNINRKWWTPEEMITEGVYPFGRTNLYKSLRNGTIPSLKMGKKYVVPKGAFEAWLESCGKTTVA